MTDDELREACEMAGGEVYRNIPDSRHDTWIAVFDVGSRTFRYGNTNPALPAYVASRLVAMVRERGIQNDYLLRLMQENRGRRGMWMLTATDEQRGCAAMEVLRDR